MDCIGKIMTHHETQCSKKEYQRIWAVKNFRNYCCKKNWLAGYPDFSPDFFTGDNYEHKWYFEIFPGGFRERFSKSVGLCFNLQTKDESDDSLFTVRVSILDEDGNKHSRRSSVLSNESRESTEFIIKDFINKEELLSNPKLLPGGKLRILCEIFVNTPETSGTIDSSKKSNILDRVLAAEKYADFIFVVGTKKFNVHRAILAARSPVFEAMFDSSMRESKEGKVHIDDIEPEIMEKLLRFVYVSELENVDDLADKLLVAAEKYQIDELKQLCEDVLVKRLSLANVYDTLRVADANVAENLKKKTFEFIRRNAKKLTAQENFKAQVNSLPGHLKTDIIGDLMDKL